MLLPPDASRQLFLRAAAQRFALLAVNADSPAAVVDVLEAARRADAPVIVEASLWQLTGRSFGAGDPLLGLARYLADLQVLANSERFAQVPVLFHTDHIKGPQTLEILFAAIAGEPGASSLSLDSSELSEAQNVALAGRLCQQAGMVGRGLTLEMEAGVDDGLTPLEVTDRIVGGIEAAYPGYLALWAPGCGTRHGFSGDGFPQFSADHVQRQQERASQIAGRPIGIALHGSSGLEEEALREAVAAGVVKVNWSSESLFIRAQAAREYYVRFGDRLEAGAPGFKAAAMDDGLQRFVAERYIPRVLERIDVLGGAGKRS